MESILKRLNEEEGVKGCLVVTHDGIVVAGVLQSEVRKEVVGALSSFLIAATDRCLKNGELGSLGRMMMTATHGKVVILALKGYYLVTLTDQFTDMEHILKVANEAAAQLLKVATIDA
ncbi:MAG: roadblock/LC7 domain-containing protein [Planctomycetota bacterium]